MKRCASVLWGSRAHLNDDDGGRLTRQEVTSRLQMPSDQEAATASLQANDEGFAAAPQHAAAVRHRNTADDFLQGVTSQASGQSQGHAV